MFKIWVKVLNGRCVVCTVEYVDCLPIASKELGGKWKALNKAYCLTFNFNFVGITIVVGFYIYLYPETYHTCTVGSVSFSDITQPDCGAQL